jgi:proline iminopeptidase
MRARREENAMAPDAGDNVRSGRPPLSKQMLAVGDGHDLYVETVGTADGRPAVYLHGGPGSGCQPDHARLFDPTHYRAVLFDQRGCGLSRPKRGREANTTDHLIADMETIRATLGIERWLVVGGSWGATLALAYAQRHPERVSGIVLRATFLGTRAELDSAFLDALPRIYPGLFDDFLKLLPEAERRSPLEAYWRRILDPDPAVHGPASRAWHDTERILSEHKPGRTRLDASVIADGSRPLPATPLMEAHYFQHDCFMAPNQLLDNAPRLAGIRGIIVQSRYDLLCPPATAHALASAWPDAEIRMVEAAGHSLYDPGVRDAVAKAIADMADVIA